MLKIAGALLAVVLGAMLLVSLLFDPNDYKGDAEAAFLARTGRALTLEGDLSLSFFPWLAVKTGTASIGNRTGFGDGSFAAVKRVRVAVRLLPLLLRQEVSVGKVDVDGLELNLQVAKNGRDNWSDMLEHASKTRAEGPADGTETTDVPMDMGIASLRLRDARVTFDDHKAGTRYELRDWDLETGKLHAGRPFDLSSSVVLLSGDEPMVRVEIETEVDPSQPGRIAARDFDGAVVLQRVGPKHSEVPVKLRTKEIVLDVAGKSATIGDLQAQFDDTRIKGSVSIADIKRMALRFDLQADQLDIDRYRAPPAKDAPPPAAADGPARPLPVNALRTLDCNGMFRVGRLTAAGLTFEKLAIPLVAKNGRLRVDPAEARAFGGRVWMRLVMDVTSAKPRLHIQPRFVDVDARQMLDQTIGVTQLTGCARIEAALDGAGADVAALKRSLRGPFDIAVNDGALVGADLWHEIERAFAVAQGRAPPAGTGSGRTEFDVLRARGTLANMTLRNESLEFSTDFLRVRGRGDVGLGSGTVDLRLKARMLRVPPGRLLGMETSQLQGADVPVTVTGQIADPKVRPDVGALLGEAVKREVTKQLEDNVRKKLQDLLGR